MLNVLSFIIVAIAIFIGIVWKNQRTLQGRQKLLQKPFPLQWIDWLDRDLYLYRRLPPLLRKELHQHINVFLTEKKFIEQEGMTISDRAKLIIAAQACILLLGDPNRHRNYFPYLQYIYVYPHTFVNQHNYGNLKNSVLLGQSSVGHKAGNDGIVSLSWAQISKEIEQAKPMENVVIHEFAHQLDQEFGDATGTPRLPSLEDTLVWGEIFANEYKKHYQNVIHHRETIIDRYGATNPVEFFAVATEAFFLKSRELEAYHSLLFDQLKKYYGVNPANWK